AARTAAGRLAARCGERVDDPRGGLTHLFPAPEALAGVAVAMPAARRRTLAALVSALADGDVALDPGRDRERALAALERLPGIGPWTSGIVAMRALGDPDAFVAGDLGVRRGAAALGLPPTPAALAERSKRWRPWRAYAVQHLWAALDHPINRWAQAA
ncbi:MAG TPA: DNA-3-methyladenine glycosylase, partial [Solirubrobacteraceae bacterium]|nr:DNA-3-methyladenine glycosylase [Solirubrobacteraceae bacterium]